MLGIGHRVNVHVILVTCCVFLMLCAMNVSLANTEYAVVILYPYPWYYARLYNNIIILYGNVVQLVMDHCANVKGSGGNDWGKTEEQTHVTCNSDSQRSKGSFAIGDAHGLISHAIPWPAASWDCKIDDKNVGMQLSYVCTPYDQQHFHVIIV